MRRALFLECVAGVAGDMFAASFLDAGLVSVDEFNGLAKQLGLEGVIVEAESVTRATMRATHLKVTWQDESWKLRFGNGNRHHHSDHHHNTNLLLGDEVRHHWHTHYSDIEALIRDSSLDQATKELSQAIFSALAEAEGAAHGISIGEVAFHEVGTIDSIMDVVMAAFCVTRTGAEAMFATPVKIGRGVVTMQHGTHPIPPPASARLLTGIPISKTPAAITRENIELSTPTGIAILKSLAPTFVDEMPAGTLVCQGMGAGSTDLSGYPNVFRVSLLDIDGLDPELPYEADTVVEIVCNIDDDTAEHLAWISEKLIERGALDVWQTAATGKKGRVLVSLSVLVEEADFRMMADWILRNSTTFGIRYRKWDRLKLARRLETRDTPSGPVRFKLGLTTDGQVLKEKAEHDDVARLSDVDKGRF